MNFKEATNRLTSLGVTLTEVARAFGVTPNTVSRWRANGKGANRFGPPESWRATVHKLALSESKESARRSRELYDLAFALEAD